MKIFSGTGVGGKKSSGIIRFFKEKSETQAIKDSFTTCENELKRLDNAITRVKRFLEGAHKKATQQLGDEEGKIFEIHLML